MKENFLGLAHISVLTDDLTSSLQFYTQVLFFTKQYATTICSPEGNKINYALITLGDCAIELLQTGNKIICQRAALIDHIAIRVKHINFVYEYLKSKNVNFKTEIFDLPDLMNGCKGFFIYGPSGELIEIFEIL